MRSSWASRAGAARRSHDQRPGEARGYRPGYLPKVSAISATLEQPTSTLHVARDAVWRLGATARSNGSSCVSYVHGSNVRSHSVHGSKTGSDGTR